MYLFLFEVTPHCNLECRYCYNHWHAGTNEPPPRGSYQNARRTLKQLFRSARVQHIGMTGGEPFLAERFAELVLLSRMRGAAVTIVSNGNAAGRKDY